MTRRKYDTPEEAAEAKREQARLRRAIIKQLIDQYKMQRQARETEALARASLARPQPKAPQPDATKEMWSRMLRHPTTRDFIIHTLLKEHYDELKHNVDAYRLIKG